jgi:hypothetical protein
MSSMALIRWPSTTTRLPTTTRTDLGSNMPTCVKAIGRRGTGAVSAVVNTAGACANLLASGAHQRAGVAAAKQEGRPERSRPMTRHRVTPLHSPHALRSAAAGTENLTAPQLGGVHRFQNVRTGCSRTSGRSRLHQRQGPLRKGDARAQRLHPPLYCEAALLKGQPKNNFTAW